MLCAEGVEGSDGRCEVVGGGWPGEEEGDKPLGGVGTLNVPPRSPKEGSRGTPPARVVRSGVGSSRRAVPRTLGPLTCRSRFPTTTARPTSDLCASIPSLPLVGIPARGFPVSSE